MDDGSLYMVFTPKKSEFSGLWSPFQKSKINFHEFHKIRTIKNWYGHFRNANSWGYPKNQKFESSGINFKKKKKHGKFSFLTNFTKLRTKQTLKGTYFGKAQNWGEGIHTSFYTHFKNAQRNFTIFSPNWSNHESIATDFTKAHSWGVLHASLPRDDWSLNPN